MTWLQIFFCFCYFYIVMLIVSGIALEGDFVGALFWPIRLVKWFVSNFLRELKR